MALQELLDRNELQRLQDEFCTVAGVSAYCIDHDGTKITRISGDDRYLHSVQERTAFERVQDMDSLEDLAVEDLDEGRQVAALAIKARGEKELYWIVYRPESMEEGAFYHTLDLLRDASISFLQGKIQTFSAEADSIRNEAASQKMGRTIRMVRAMTEIVHLMESEEPIEALMSEWLGTVSTFLGLDTAQIFKLQEDDKFMDVICEWKKQGMVSFFDRTSKIATISFLKTKIPIIVNADSINQPEYADIRNVGIKALILYPLCPQESNTGMVLSLNHRKGYSFDDEEKAFAADAVRVLENILVRRIQKNALIGAKASLESILDHVNTCIYVRDIRKHKALFANRQMQRVFEEELKTGTISWLLEKQFHLAELDSIEDGPLSREVYYEEKDCWYDLTVTDMRWTDGSEARMYSLFDITEKKHYQGRIEQQAYTDFLTGLYNRICCERDLAVQIDSAKKTETIGALLYLDLDDFKHINDGLGHQYGDALLKAISHAFQRIEGIERTCYRMGGDEFVIIVPPGYYEDLDRILEEIQRIFRKPWFLKDSDYYCTMSMGVVTFPDNGDSVPDLVKKADIAMYAAKRAGKNRIEFYSDNISSSDRRRLDMEKNMRDATAKNFGEFEIYYQPIINVQGEEPACVGAEALIRWNSSNLGFVTPMEFIPLAEYLGLINPIGNHVLLEACRHCKEWNDRGYDFKVNVNLSVIQLLQRDIVDIIDNALKGTGLKPDHLTLEVTESLAINDMERMKKILGKIKELGVKLALDDFGTGYSSLNHIREIPFDVIKVDQSFVKELAEDAYSQSFIKLVSELAETIGVSICVEGIENPMQYQVLHGMKVKYIQGYYFDRPLRQKDFERRYCVPQGVMEKREEVQTRRYELPVEGSERTQTPTERFIAAEKFVVGSVTPKEPLPWTVQPEVQGNEQASKDSTAAGAARPTLPERQEGASSVREHLPVRPMQPGRQEEVSPARKGQPVRPMQSGRQEEERAAREAQLAAKRERPSARPEDTQPTRPAQPSRPAEAQPTRPAQSSRPEDTRTAKTAQPAKSVQPTELEDQIAARAMQAMRQAAFENPQPAGQKTSGRSGRKKTLATEDTAGKPDNRNTDSGSNIIQMPQDKK